jgi:2-polyprenyl-6-methoxyphenol hydroxylase-like FAD-dependent oxidoreductase
MEKPVDNPRPLEISVIGASFAGLFAAAAAATAGHRVTIIERDVLPAGPQARRGVPQSEQTHILLHRGLVSAEQLLPGLHEELTKLGAPEFKSGLLPLLGAEGWAPRGDYGYTLVCVSRVLLEQVVRQRVLALPNVHLVEGTRVRGLDRTATGTWTLNLHDVDQSDDDVDVSTLSADMVIDASGRSSRMPTWLEQLNVPKVRSTTVDAQVGYATRRFTSPRPPGPGVIVLATPERSRGCMVSPVEDGQWMVSTVGVGESRPGRDGAAFYEHLAKVVDPLPQKLVQEMTPVGDVTIHRQTGNIRHRYEQARRWPEGLIVVGDALCAVNPMYGQGITVAASQGVTLHRAFTTAHRLPDTRRLQRRLARAGDLPWTMATCQDRQLITTPDRPRPVEKVVAFWGTEVARLAMNGHGQAAEAMQGVTHLMKHPVTMFTPAIVLASVKSRLRLPRARPAMAQTDPIDVTAQPVQEAATISVHSA